MNRLRIKPEELSLQKYSNGSFRNFLKESRNAGYKISNERGNELYRQFTGKELNALKSEYSQSKGRYYLISDLPVSSLKQKDKDIVNNLKRVKSNVKIAKKEYKEEMLKFKKNPNYHSGFYFDYYILGAFSYGTEVYNLMYGAKSLNELTRKIMEMKKRMQEYRGNGSLVYAIFDFNSGKLIKNRF